MDRLTTEFGSYFVPKEFIEVDKYNIAAECKDCWEICEKANNNCYNCTIQKAFGKLAAYENTNMDPAQIEVMLAHNTALIEQNAEYAEMEEQGRLVRLPCKPGDIVYEIRDRKILPQKVAYIEISITAHTTAAYIVFATSGCVRFEHFGRTVFRNKLDALTALESKKG